MTTPQPSLMSEIAAQRVAEELGKREGTIYKFFRFLKLSKVSLVFVTTDNQQRILTVEHAQEILNQKG